MGGEALGRGWGGGGAWQPRHQTLELGTVRRPRRRGKKKNLLPASGTESRYHTQISVSGAETPPTSNPAAFTFV